jgi:hypothetical protein
LRVRHDRRVRQYQHAIAVQSRRIEEGVVDHVEGDPRFQQRLVEAAIVPAASDYALPN